MAVSRSVSFETSRTKLILYSLNIRWIFILVSIAAALLESCLAFRALYQEGMATCIIALASLLVLHGGVATVPFLTEEERESTLTALRADKAFNEEVEPLKGREIWSVFTSPQLIILTPAFFANGILC